MTAEQQFTSADLEAAQNVQEAAWDTYAEADSAMESAGSLDEFYRLQEIRNNASIAYLDASLYLVKVQQALGLL